MEIISIVGTRPQYVKLAVVYHAFKALQIDHNYIDTGQHYSKSLSAEVITDLELPDPYLNLKAGGSEPINQIASMIEGIADAVKKIKPKFALVYGDTNSTLAASIALCKSGVPFGHIEAGLRSFNKQMPEEINRIVSDHVSTRLYAPTIIAMRNLKEEGLESKSILTGDLIVESLIKSADKKIGSIDKNSTYLIATFHRQENVDSKNRLEELFFQLSLIPIEIRLFSHPRLLLQLKAFNIKISKNIKIFQPVPHNQLLNYLRESIGIITDSGGLIKEAYVLGKTCTTVRNEVEWIETLEDNWNVLCTNLNELSKIALRESPTNNPQNHFGNGNATDLILKDIRSFM